MLDALLFTKTSKLLTKLYSECLWKKETSEKVLYLTFDDGPIPEITPWVLDELKRWNAKATFFCIGKNIAANPAIFKRIINEGHSVGNHTCNHLSGWKHTNKIYFDDIAQCKTILAKHGIKGDNGLFRPPYGKLKISQYRALKEEYRIVMWDVLTFDFDLKVSGKRVLKTAVKHATPGSVIVFHDSIKAAAKVEYALPKVLEHFTAQGYRFKAIV